MVHGKNRIPYWIDRRLNGLAGPEYHAIISFGLPIEPEDSQYGKSWLMTLRAVLMPRNICGDCAMPSLKRSYWDASTWIKLISNKQDQQAVKGRWRCQQFFEEALHGHRQLLTSAVSIVEVLRVEIEPGVSPLPMPPKVEEQIATLFDEPYVVLIPLDPARAQEARDLRRRVPWLKTADAIHVASAVYAQADVLHTFDGAGGQPRRMLQLDGMVGNPPLAIMVPRWEGQLAIT